MKHHFPDSEPSSGFILLQPGYYKAVIKKVEEKISEKGANMYKCTYALIGKYGQGRVVAFKEIPIVHYIVFPGNSDDPDSYAFMLNKIAGFLKILGEPYRGKIEIEPMNWINKHIAVKIKNTEYKGEMQNTVHYVVSEEKAISETLTTSTILLAPPKGDIQKMLGEEIKQPDFSDIKASEMNDIPESDIPF